MMYDPNVFTLNLEQLLSGAPIDAAIGVLKVTVRHARGIKGSKIGGGTPDPFVSISINNTRELATTKYKHNTWVTGNNTATEWSSYTRLFIQHKPHMERDQVYPRQQPH